MILAVANPRSSRASTADAYVARDSVVSVPLENERAP